MSSKKAANAGATQSRSGGKSKQTTGLVKKLVEIRHSLGKVEKTKRNPHFGYNYVGLEQLNALLEPKLTEHNILFTTSLVSEEVRYGEAKEGVFAKVITEHEYHDADSSEKLAFRSSGLGWDAGDKATAKAMTASIKSHLKANFMVSDEADDTEAGEERPAAAAPKGADKHRPTREYEMETGDGDAKVAQDVLELKAFLTENKIPDGFLLTMLTDKKLIDGHTKNVAQLKPGILRRCLDEKSKANLIAAWKNHQTDEESGSANAPDPVKKNSEVRTREGDQRAPSLLRKPIDEGTDPQDLLAQDGYENWREVKVHWGNDKDKTLGSLTAKNLLWWVTKWVPKPYKGTWNEKDILLDAALVLASQELEGARE
jgi:hypothetical protein